MKIIRLRLSKPKTRPAPRRWMAAALHAAQTHDATLTNRRAASRPEALDRAVFNRARVARTA